MSISAEQKRLVQSSFALVAPEAEAVAQLFYDRLFTLDPSVRALFPTEMAEQGRKLMNMLAAAVKGLDKVDALIPVLQMLAVRHAGYGVQEHHYDTVGAALLWTLEQGLGEAFTPAVREAWAAVYGVISSVMISAANEALVPA